MDTPFLRMNRGPPHSRYVKGWNDTEKILSALPVIRSSIRWGSRSRTSTRSGGGAPSMNRAMRSMPLEIGLVGGSSTVFRICGRCWSIRRRGLWGP